MTFNYTVICGWNMELNLNYEFKFLYSYRMWISVITIIYCFEGDTYISPYSERNTFSNYIII